MILTGIIGGVLWGEVSVGETISVCLQAAKQAAGEYRVTVAFEFNDDRHYTFPDGSHRRFSGSLVTCEHLPEIASYAIGGAEDEQSVAPLEIPKAFSKPKAWFVPLNGKRKLIL